MTAATYPLGNWREVTKADPCPYCEKPDWCAVGLRGRLCMRVTGGKEMPSGGSFFGFGDEKPKFEILPASVTTPNPEINCKALLHAWRRSSADEQMNELAASLDLPLDILSCLGVCWAPEYSAWAFPMFGGDAALFGAVPIGIRLRTRDGKKFAVKGSRSGVFFPQVGHAGFAPPRVFITEGPTDCAAMLTAGCFAMGRASCRGGEDIIISILNDMQPPVVCVIADNDGPGVEGAEHLVRSIQQPVLRLVPPGKDMRAFFADGGTLALLGTMLADITPSTPTN